MLPHFIYGSGESALSFTKEYGSASKSENENNNAIIEEQQKLLCQKSADQNDICKNDENNFIPPAILFIAQVVSGVGYTLYYSVGVSYMDDNIKKSKTPILICFSFFLRMLGPAIGYGLASFSLQFYISPTLSPTIDVNDPR